MGVVYFRVDRTIYLLLTGVFFLCLGGRNMEVGALTETQRKAIIVVMMIILKK
jgi:hypothetical protein